MLQRLALAGSALFTVLVFWAFAGGVSEGLGWEAMSRRAIVSPDLEVPDGESARPVPGFTLPDRFGNQISLSQFGSVDVLVVNIWSSGCPACEEEVPALAEMDRRLARAGSVALLTIAAEEGWDDVAHFFPRGTDLRVLFDPEERVTRGVFGTKRYPETFVLDRQRRVRARFDGKRQWYAPEMIDYLVDLSR